MKRNTLLMTLLFATLYHFSCDKKADLPARCNLPTGESQCISDSQCNDGLYCNGEELCEPSNTAASRCGCVRRGASTPCTQTEGLVCVEISNSCITEYCYNTGSDLDGDGTASLECGGADCDDSDPLRFPGNPEVCDGLNLDEDCNPATFGTRDTDRDEFVDVNCCNGSGGSAVCGDDCDDNRGSVNPATSEVCNWRDDNCDGSIDEEVVVQLYADTDGDGYGAGDPLWDCADRANYSTLGNDCDDSTPSVYPGMLRCTDKGGGEYEYCETSGFFSVAYCPQAGVCIPQPGGWGICAYTPQ